MYLDNIDKTITDQIQRYLVGVNYAQREYNIELLLTYLKGLEDASFEVKFYIKERKENYLTAEFYVSAYEYDKYKPEPNCTEKYRIYTDRIEKMTEEEKNK